MNRIFNITFLFSLCGHLLSLTVFEPTLGEILPQNNPLKIFFLGSLFTQKELCFVNDNSKLLVQTKQPSDKLIFVNLRTVPLEPIDKNLTLFYAHIERPLFSLAFDSPKILFYPKTELTFSRQEVTLNLRPYLPYSFILYFRDRQKANLEFLFYISKEGNLTCLKRRISSGNPELDSLVLRHLNRSLYLIKDSFPFDCWQNVKIELTSQNDQN